MTGYRILAFTICISVHACYGIIGLFQESTGRIICEQSNLKSCRKEGLRRIYLLCKNMSTLYTGQTEVTVRKKDGPQSKKCLTKQEKHVKMAKIFFLQDSPRQPLQARVLFLHNSSVVTYPYYIKGRFRAVAYISSYRRLIIGTYDSRQVIFMSVTDGNQTVVKESIAVFSIAVDETKGLVFLKIYLKKYMICAMTTEGNDYKMVFSPRSEPKGVTVDCKRSRIYIALRDGIYMYSYQGGYKGRVALKTIFRLLFVDTENDVLYYYAIQKHIYEMSMSDKKSTLRFKEIFYYVRELIRFESTIFMRILTQKSILVLSKNGTRSYITGLTTSDYRMCLID